ncbi:MAG: HD domain-containing protein [Cyanobacteria bacterium REEB67]|nr:HD domain-containing protein [Cyanobacteria bacterium REEB67]
MTEKLSVTEAAAVIQSLYDDREILDLYAAGDKLSSGQTKHDIGHAFSVLSTAEYLTGEIHKRFPEKLDDETRKVVIPAGAFLHDIGRAIDVADHAGAGAKVTRTLLEPRGIDTDVIKRIQRIVALHRSSAVLKMKFNDPAWAIVVIADKCVGDEDRVRPNKAAILRGLRFLRIAHINWWDNAEHDRVNFAIKMSNLLVDSDDSPSPAHAGAIVLKLTLDEVVAPATELLALYADRFHSCGRAAKYLGFVFRIEINGVRWLFDDDKDKWRPIRGFSVPLPSTIMHKPE